MRLTELKDAVVIFLSFCAIGLGIFSHSSLNSQIKTLLERQDWNSERESNRSNVIYLKDYIKKILKNDTYMANLSSSKECTVLNVEGERILEKLGITSIISVMYSADKNISENDILLRILSTDEYQRNLSKYNKKITDPEKKISFKAILGAAAIKFENIQK